MGHCPLDEVVGRYKRVGYDFVMMSEHFTHHFNYPIADTRHLRGNDFTTILGAELHAPVTSAGEWWHIVAAGLPLDFEPVQKGETGPEIATARCCRRSFHWHRPSGMVTTHHRRWPRAFVCPCS